ncbi:hypothetical protein GGI25_006162 [Coemansia spiralis]|uniref:Uncharacterized protein n=1 Tax=Coemansia spiralis TaxID=417178 RepID=A0A9W8G0Z4_9FUNG|nr:hypothetical protein GGI25_006162 [Coemansia spiralis]
MLCGISSKTPYCGLLIRAVAQIRNTSHRWFASTSSAPRLSERFKIQFKLPGRTTGVLSSGVVPYPNDPMIPQGKYFKPKGLDKITEIPTMLKNKTLVYRLQTKGFMLIASPWNMDEHPRDHNGLRIRDYRVTAIASKKQYSKKAHPRWQIMRMIRTAAAMILPDKGMKRCDYLFIAFAEMRKMSRDEIFLMIEKAFVDVEAKIKRDWAKNGRRARRVSSDMNKPSSTGIATSTGASSSGGDDKILDFNFADDHKRKIQSLSSIIEDM